MVTPARRTFSTADAVWAQPALTIARYRLEFEAMELVRLPEYSGSAWRGAFGHSLKKTVCVTRLPECKGCLLYRSCLYPRVFETPPPQDSTKMRRYPAAPHPFVVAPESNGGGDLAVGSRIRVRLMLIGSAIPNLSYFVHAFEQAGRRGVGRGKGRLALRQVEEEEEGAGSGRWRTIYEPGGPLTLKPREPLVAPAAPEVLRIECHAPMRLRRNGRNVGPEAFRFADLFSTLLRRISMLSYFHTSSPLETDFRGLVAQAGEVPLVENRLRWQDWTRYSSRQKTTMQMGGLVGDFTVDLQGRDGFWPYLWLGQWTHAGHAASMGLGRYSVAAASLPVNTRANIL